MTCNEIIQSNDTIDIIIPTESLERPVQTPDCEQPIGGGYTVFYFNRDHVPKLAVGDYTYSSIPKCFGTLDTTALEMSGITQLGAQPSLALKGKGVLMGFIDTGIAYENACFRNADGSSRIRSIWDQTATPDAENTSPDGFLYGVEYTKKQLDIALASDNPRDIVPTTDNSGHGTILASIAAGSEDPTADFSGAAPLSDLVVVKLKPAKRYLKDYFFIPENTLCFQENDILAAVTYLEKKAEEYGRPIVICLALGTNNGSHAGGSVLSEYLNYIGGIWRRCIVTAAGNEAAARHHFHGISQPKTDVPVGVEINVDESMRGFYLELWASAPKLFTVSLRSPGGTLLPLTATRRNSHQEYEFRLENTLVTIDYRTVGRTRGDQLIFVRFAGASRGIWTLLVYPDTSLTGTFDVWLPMTGMLERDVFFLKPDPDVTLTVPGTANIPITVGGYSAAGGGIYLSSGRGFTAANAVKPDFAAPAVNVQAVDTRNRYTAVTGTSAAAAITAGACAQLMEWGAVRRTDISLNSVEIGNILIRGCRRDTDRSYPNPQWGYGTLDAYEAFRQL